jgi:hypothetical protein
MQSASQITLQQDLAYRDSLLIDRVTDIEIDSSGTIFIAGEAWERREIIRFDRIGNRLDTFGGYGTDNGRFLQIDGIQLADEQLFVFDGDSERITVLDAAKGDPLQSINTPADKYAVNRFGGEASAVPIHRFKNDAFLISLQDDRNPAYYPDRQLIYMRVDSSGEMIQDSVLIQQDIKFLIGDYAGRPAPFTLDRPEKSLLEITEDGHLFSAHTRDFLIEQYTPEGVLENTIYRRMDRAPLNQEEIVENRFSHNEQLLMVHRAADYPEIWPALYSMISDDRGRLWVSTITPNRDVFEWWVIEPDGTYSVFSWPASRRILHVEDGMAYVVEKDDTGYDQVTRYRYTFRESASQD